MSTDNKAIASAIIDFLKQSVSDKSINEDYADSMDVAIDCIADAFEVDKDQPNLLGKSLKDIVKTGLAGSTTDAPVSDSTAKEVDADTKAKANELKLEGNRAMASKNFDEAIKKYTEAIKLDNTNVVYLSNRAAAYSSNLNHEKAVEDAEKAIELDPNFSKSYSRLGLAKYALGDAKAAMEAYKKGLAVEGEKKSDAMKRGYETAKRRVEEELEKDMPKTEVASQDKAAESSSGSSAGAGAGAGAGGLPDFSSMFGGGAGGMPNLGDMMNNPQIMQAAQQMMSNPDALANLMNNPMIKNMAQSMGLGGENGDLPDMSNLMNNPALRDMFGGGQGGSSS